MRPKIVHQTIAQIFERGRVIAKLADQGKPIPESHIVSYDPDDGPLTEEDIAWIGEISKPMMPKGRLLKKTALIA